LGSFFAIEPDLAIGKRLGITSLANLGNKGAPLIAITNVLGALWAGGEPEDLVNMAVIGGASAILQVRWPLNPARRAVIDDFLIASVRRGDVYNGEHGATTLAEAVLASDDLKPLRSAIEISGPLLRVAGEAVKPLEFTLLN
jgi:hypothetical protein